MSTERDPRWAAVLARDASRNGTFFYAVKTTGVYCRPSCAARRPNPQNVSFHSTCAEAEKAGFRPCRRCKPELLSLEAAHTGKIAAACRQIEAAEEPLRLGQLAQAAGLSPFHFHRLFKAAMGLTPKQYAAAQRGKQVREALQTQASVTGALYAAGFGSSGRFYADADAVLGMKPSRYRAGGTRTEIRFAVGQCSLGAILVARGDRGICAILLGDDPDAMLRDLQDRFPQATLVGGDDNFERLVAQVVGLVEAPAVGLDLPLDIRGTAFQQRVWRALRLIPTGTTVSYAEIARRIGAPRATRAVAGACAANPLAVAIPCHRVVRTDGGLSGYRWGIERKRTLLQREVTP